MGISAAKIAGELCVRHPTLFNRFGTKEGLMFAALGPPEKVPWVAALDAGPDDRPIRRQLVEHGKVMSAYFHELHSGLALLRAAGVTPEKVWQGHTGEPPPVLAFHALTAWLPRAPSQGHLARCDVETLAAAILGAMHNWVFATVRKWGGQ